MEISQSEKIRADLIKYGESRKYYEQIRLDVLSDAEGFETRAYDDAKMGNGKYIDVLNAAGEKPKGNVTVGIGFNMGNDDVDKVKRKTEAKDEWDKAFNKISKNSRPDFDKIFYGKENLSKEQVIILYEYSITVREKELESYYKDNWEKLKPNEKLAIEDMYYNSPGLVKPGTKSKPKNFYNQILTYVTLNDKNNLNNALWEVRYNSNPKDKRTGKRSIGLQKRRESQSELLNTYGVDINKIPTPFYYIDEAKRNAERGRKEIEKIIKQMFELRKGKISRMLNTHKQMLLSDIKRQAGHVVDFHEPKLGQQAAVLEDKYALMLVRYDEFLQHDINDIIDGLMSEGQTPEEIKAVLTEYFIEQPRRISELEENFAIVLRQKMDKDRQQLIGIGKYMWVTAGDDKVRSAHAANSGQIFFWKKPPVTGNPGDDYNCRCQARPVV